MWDFVIDNFDSQTEEAKFLIEGPLSLRQVEKTRIGGMMMTSHAEDRLRRKRSEDKLSKEGHPSLFRNCFLISKNLFLHL